MADQPGVILAVTAAAAVLTGALVVGDSMRGSLRHLLLDQLGRIDEVLVSDHFFRADLATELAAQPGFRRAFDAAVPAVFVSGSIENPHGQDALRAGRVTVIGCTESFWLLGSGGPPKTPAAGEIVLNEPLAMEIDAKPGDEVLLRIGSVSQIPPDSALGRKTETVRNRRLKVIAVIPAEGLGRFSLFPNQQLPHDAFVAIETLQDALEQPHKVNAIFVAGRGGAVPKIADDDDLAQAFHPTLADYGIQIETHPGGFVQCMSDRMLLEPAAVEALDKAFAADHPQAVFTYLANTIAGGGHEIPYSTITAIDFATQPPLGPFTTPEGETIEPLADDEIALNAWAAEDLGVHPGDAIEITYFEPESTHAQVREKKHTFRLRAIVAMTGPAADKDLTPQMPGVTDRLSIGDWTRHFRSMPGACARKTNNTGTTIAPHPRRSFRWPPVAGCGQAVSATLRRFASCRRPANRSRRCERGCSSSRPRSGCAFYRSSGWNRGRQRHHAVRRAVRRLQLVHHDLRHHAGGDSVPLGNRAPCGADRHFACHWHA